MFSQATFSLDQAIFFSSCLPMPVLGDRGMAGVGFQVVKILRSNDELVKLLIRAWKSNASQIQANRPARKKSQLLADSWATMEKDHTC